MKGKPGYYVAAVAVVVLIAGGACLLLSGCHADTAWDFTVTITTPGSEAEVSGVITVNVSYTLEYAPGTIRIVIGGITKTSGRPVRMSAAGTFAETLDISALADGRYELTVRLQDTNNETTSHTVWVNVRNAAAADPAITITSPADGSDVTTDALDVTVDGTIGAVPATIDLALDGVQETVTNVNALPRTVSLDVSTVADGDYTLTVTITDADARTATHSVAVEICLGRQWLDVDVTEPAVGATLAGPYTVRATASGGTPPYTYVMSLGPVEETFTGNALNLVGLDSTLVPNGLHELTVFVTDTRGVTGDVAFYVTVAN